MDGQKEHNRGGKNKHNRGYQKQTTSGGGLRGVDMHYVPYHTNPDCNYIVLSNRAAKAIIAETLSHGRNETGGILLGNFNNGIWYIVEAIDPGLDTVNHSVNFEFDPVYVNHLTEKIGVLYHHPLTILGVWHRHPGSMDTFSFQDMESMANMTNDARIGMISMLVNLDPELRMTFYYCNKSGEVMPVYYDIGDDYFVPEILAYAANETLCSRIGRGNASIRPHQVFPPEAIGGSIANLRAAACAPSSDAQTTQSPADDNSRSAADETTDPPAPATEDDPPATETEARTVLPAEMPAEPAAEEQEAAPADAAPAEDPEQSASDSTEPDVKPPEIISGQWIPFDVVTPETAEASEPQAAEEAVQANDGSEAKDE